MEGVDLLFIIDSNIIYLADYFVAIIEKQDYSIFFMVLLKFNHKRLKYFIRRNLVKNWDLIIIVALDKRLVNIIPLTQ